DSFFVTGSVLYSGKVSIKNGQISAVSRIPKDVEYGNKSKIMLYGWSNNLDAAGVTENLVISGTETLESDTVGPNISIYFDNLSFRSGDVIPPTTTLIVRLEDESGINTSTLGIGHKLTANLANPEQEIDLSNYYQTDLDTYQSGEVRYSLSNLPIGKNYVRVKAWDVYNNSSEETVSFEVVAASDIALTQIFNYPNPFSKSTYFTFQRSGEAPVAIEIKIYTVAGRMIRRIELPLVTERFVQVLWDGRDAEGDEVANGIYFYKISSYNIDTRESKEYIGKIARVM
nr:T9SS type A sorting domain-containing protein [Bacteroidota bacterium]